MIEKIGIKDFKSYQDAELKLAPLTVLIGANASGKTNALEAIRLLSWMAQGQKLSTLQYQVNENDKVVRGNVASLPRSGQKEFTIEFALNKDTLGDFGKFNLLQTTLEVRDEGELHISYEAIRTDTIQGGFNFLYQTKARSSGSDQTIDVEYQNFKRGKKKATIPCIDQMSIFLQLANASRFQESHKKSIEVIPLRAKDFEVNLSKILFLDPVPQKMRDYSFESDKNLIGNGDNLSSVIYHLWNKSKDKISNQKFLLQFISSLPEQNITDISFIITPRREVMLQLIETFGNKEQVYDASLLSDGTLRVLAYAAALLSAPEDSIVIVEEIDNGLHPSRADQLLNSINEIAKKRNLTVLISSHNPALLNALPEEAVPKVVFCYRDPKNGYSKLTRLEDLPHYPELLTQGPIGDLLTRGLVDQFVKNQPTEEERKRKAQEWLEAIK